MKKLTPKVLSLFTAAVLLLNSVTPAFAQTAPNSEDAARKEKLRAISNRSRINHGLKDIKQRLEVLKASVKPAQIAVEAPITAAQPTNLPVEMLRVSDKVYLPQNPAVAAPKAPLYTDAQINSIIARTSGIAGYININTPAEDIIFYSEVDLADAKANLNSTQKVYNALEKEIDLADRLGDKNKAYQLESQLKAAKRRMNAAVIKVTEIEDYMAQKEAAAQKARQAEINRMLRAKNPGFLTSIENGLVKFGNWLNRTAELINFQKPAVNADYNNFNANNIGIRDMQANNFQPAPSEPAAPRTLTLNDHLAKAEANLKYSVAARNYYSLEGEIGDPKVRAKTLEAMDKGIGKNMQTVIDLRNDVELKAKVDAKLTSITADNVYLLAAAIKHTCLGGCFTAEELKEEVQQK